MKYHNVCNMNKIIQEKNIELEDSKKLFVEDTQMTIEQQEDSVQTQCVEVVDDAKMQAMMAAMDANLEKQNNPKVGIFWYSPLIKDVFGVVAVDAHDQAQIEHREAVSCKELHKYVWKKKYNYYKFHGGSNLYVGDYKYVPRGRVFYFPETDEYDIMVGKWIYEYPEAVDKIKAAFDLNDRNLFVHVKLGIHKEIGMGYGE